MIREQLSKAQEKMLEKMEEISAMGHEPTGLSSDIFAPGIPAPIPERKVLIKNSIYDDPKHRLLVLEYTDELLFEAKGGKTPDNLKPKTPIDNSAR